jgi:hypothetical protein
MCFVTCLRRLLISSPSCVLCLFTNSFVTDSFVEPPIFGFLFSSKEGPIQANPASAASEAPEADEG